MRLFFLTHSLIGLINGTIFILTNPQVVLMGLNMTDSSLYSVHTFDLVEMSWVLVEGVVVVVAL